MILWRVSKRAPKVYGKCDELTYLSGKRTEHIVNFKLIAIVFSLESRFIYRLFLFIIKLFYKERKTKC